MPRITKEQKTEILRLHKKGLARKKIAERVGVKYMVVHGQVSHLDRGFKSRAAYANHLAQRRIDPRTGEEFKSDSDYQEFRAKQRIDPETGKPFRSTTDYQLHKMRIRGHDNPTAYEEFLTARKGHLSSYDYRKHLALQIVDPRTGERFKSRHEYQKYLRKVKALDWT